MKIQGFVSNVSNRQSKSADGKKTYDNIDITVEGLRLSLSYGLPSPEVNTEISCAVSTEWKPAGKKAGSKPWAQHKITGWARV